MLVHHHNLLAHLWEKGGRAVVSVCMLVHHHNLLAHLWGRGGGAPW
jgi:hypothetical protein